LNDGAVRWDLRLADALVYSLLAVFTFIYHCISCVLSTVY